jgi:hypothetical protein
MGKRSSIVGGVILILAGGILLLLQMFPALADVLDLSEQWPLIIVGVGLLFLVGAVLAAPPLAVPGAIIAGIGAILYYQNLTGDWASWAYAWTLIPGMVGLGLILSSLFAGNWRDGLPAGGRLLLISLLLFVVFGLLFGSFGQLGRYWPVLLILAGLWFLLRRRPGDRARSGS